jgi:hypothetical protein
MISVTCPSCKKVHKADESLLGKHVKCKDCGVVFEVKKMTVAVPAAVTGPTGGGISEEPIELPKDVLTTKAQRPFGLVWIVFFWIIQGVGSLFFGGILAGMGGAVGGATEITRNMFGSLRLGSALEAVLLEVLGVMLFHYGLLLLVACYGLWTFRKWGISLARGLAIVFVLLNILALIITLVNRTGIVACVAGVFISVCIMVYLYGSANLRDRLHRYIRTDGLQGSEWN